MGKQGNRIHQKVETLDKEIILKIITSTLHFISCFESSLVNAKLAIKPTSVLKGNYSLISEAYPCNLVIQLYLKDDLLTSSIDGCGI